MAHSASIDPGSTPVQAASRPIKSEKDPKTFKGHGLLKHTSKHSSTSSQGMSASPKGVVKSLRRAYSASIACMETQMRLATHSNVLHKKFNLDRYTQQDLQEVRKICEDLVYIIQLPHDQRTYGKSLRLLSSIATASDPIAFILTERHINPVLHLTLEQTPHLPQQPVTELESLLNHVNIRHIISTARHDLASLADKAILDAAEIQHATETCRKLIDVAQAPDTELWVKLIVSDIFSFIAKRPALSHVLLDSSLHRDVTGLAQLSGLATGKLARRLSRLRMSNDGVMARVKQEIEPLMVKSKLSRQDQAVIRDLCNAMFHLLTSNQGDIEEPLAYLQQIASSQSTISWILTRKEQYEIIYKLWANGTLPVTRLYNLVKEALNRRLWVAQVVLDANTVSSLVDISGTQAEDIRYTLQDLVEICDNTDLYEESYIEKAFNLLSSVTDNASEATFYLLVDVITNGPNTPNTPSTPNILTGSGDPRVKQSSVTLDVTVDNQPPKLPRLLNSSDQMNVLMQQIQDRKDFEYAVDLLKRLDQTTQWSDVNADYLRPFCLIVMKRALDDGNRRLQNLAIASLMEVADAPPNCAAVLLERSLYGSLQLLLNNRDKQLDQLRHSLQTLETQEGIRARIPELLRLSQKRQLGSPEETAALKSEITELVRLCRAKDQPKHLIQVAIHALLVLAIGFEPTRGLLNGIEQIEQYRHTLLIGRRSLHQTELENALHEIMNDLTTTTDELMRRSQLKEVEKAKVHLSFYRLMQICRLDIADWATDNAVELLGSLAKRDSSVMSLVLADTEIMKGLRTLALSANANAYSNGNRTGNGRNARIAGAIGRIIDLLRRE